MLLIDMNDIRTVRPVVSTFDTERATMYMNDAQYIDIKKMLNCDTDFVLLIENNLSEIRMQTLLNGGTYTYDAKDYYFRGLKVPLALYAYARIISANQVTVTQNGVVKKQWDAGSQIESTELRESIASVRSTASEYMDEVKLYLCRNDALFPEYEGGDKPRTGVKAKILKRA